ncbi:MAG: hypothetical protein H0U75_06530 [Legionella sp.]|nr:hypothetical protein [Legionella sp.]
MKKLSCVVWMMLILSGCARFSTNGEKIFVHSHNAPKLVVPPPLTCEYISDLYDLPPQDEDPTVSVLPPIGAHAQSDL